MARKKRSWHKLQNPNTIGVPYGDLMGDDDALERFHDTLGKCMELRRMKKETGVLRARKMSKSSFKAWKEKLFDIDDDKPLRDFI